MGTLTDALLEAEGFDEQYDMIEAYAFKSVVPGVCRDTDCLATIHTEPDQDKGWCPVCEENTVVSCLRLWGFI